MTKFLKSYAASGYVYGKYWGGGSGWFAAKTYYGNSLKVIRNQIKKDYSRGTLDSGMGYESLLGARMKIITYTVVDVNGKKYTNEKISYMSLGKFRLASFKKAGGNI